MGLVLPGAERFAAYLEERLTGTVEAIGPVRFGGVDRAWELLWKDDYLGRYCLREAADGDAIRFYYGRMPGYADESIVLQWTNILIDIEENGACKPLRKSYWQRTDSHLVIPFP